LKEDSVESKEYFGRVAAEWDELRRDFFSESLREKAIEAANVKPGMMAVDVGAGTGFITEGLVKKGVKVIAVDQSEAMLSQIKKKFGSAGAIDPRRGEAENLPVEDRVADCVFANMFLHHVENPSVAIAEMGRILKKDGVLIVTDLDEHDFNFLRKEQHDRWLGFKREDIRRWLKQAGLKRIRVECTNENCCSHSASCSEKAKISIFIAIARK
jgi:ubiquinone/menaquinone biosynthesis C-methylase UbiE